MNPKQNITIDDIARELGISKTTVSRAISGKGRISAATRARVMDYISEFNYRPSAAAKALAENRTYNLALVLPRSFIKLDLPFVRKSMSAICEEAAAHDYNILITISSDDHPDSLLRILDDRKADGVILSQTSDNLTLIRQLTGRNIPFATMGSLPQNAGAATVEADHDQIAGCREFASRWIRPGKVALLGGDMGYIVNQNRAEGFRQAVRGREDVILRTGLCSEEACRDALAQVLDLGAEQILTMDDEICVTVLQLLEAQHRSDIAVASLYDSDALKEHDPPISALHFDAAQLGRAACRELLRYLHGETHDPAPRLGYKIILR